MAAGLVIAQVTKSKVSKPLGVSPVTKVQPTSDKILTPYQLLLSGIAEKIELRANDTVVSTLEGTLALDLKNPQVSLKVWWKNSSAHSFAKLMLDIPGQETFTHVFDAEGNIDDMVEIPIISDKK